MRHGRLFDIFSDKVIAMDLSATLDSAGRIVVPASVRRRLNLSQGSRLRLEVVAERIELTPESAPEPLQRKGARMVLEPSGKPSDAAAQVRSEREAQARRGTRR